MSRASYWTNRGLFSDAYLTERLPETTAWTDLDEREVRPVLDEVSRIWERTRDDAPSMTAAELEAELVRPLFRTLGFSLDRTASTTATDRPRQRPDYVIAEPADATRIGSSRADPDETDTAFENAVAVADVRRWGRSFDTADEGDWDRGFENPTSRMAVYLRETAARWGILTDGKRWRLYTDAAGTRFDSTYEIDLEAVLAADDPNAFKYFYCFFRHDAFRTAENGNAVLDTVLEESDAVADERRDAFGERLCESLAVLAGDVRRSADNDLGVDDLETIRERSLATVYRLVVSNYLEHHRSASEHQRRDGQPESEPVDWFDGLAVTARDVDEATLERAAACLRGADVPTDDALLAADRLGRSYEDLLAYHLAIADESRPLGEDEYAGGADADHISAGDVYLTSDASDRKTTGSYYTPDYIVEYIVEQTLEPLLAEKREDSERSCDGRDAGDSFAERVFELRILDPAMGCGRFLASAANSLTRELVAWRERRAARDGVDALDPTRDIDRIRRAITGRCLYGVDTDPLAVELARLTLWLRADGDRQTLATLDDHLAVGNALVGSSLASIDGLDGETLTEALDAHDSDPYRDRLKALADVHTAREFGRSGSQAQIPDDACERLAAALSDDKAWRRLAGTAWFEAVQRRADADRYLHWELAFPEVFTADGGLSDDATGFDAVVGNPPWVATAGRADISASIETGVRTYLEETFESTDGQFDLYVAFYERMIRLARSGRVGVVVPDSILTREQTEPIRRFVLERAPPSRIVRVGTAFDGVETGAVVLISNGGSVDPATAETGPHLVACADATDRDDLRGLTDTEIPAAVFARQPATRFLIYLDETTRRILDRIDDRPPLSEFADITRGEEISKRASFLHGTAHPGTRPIAPGSAIVRYGIEESELRHVDPADIEKDTRRYRGPKLVFRQTGDSLVGTYDADGLVTIKSAYTVRAASAAPDEYKHLLGVLNSPLLNYYVQHRHVAYRSVFPQFNQSTFESLPIAMLDAPDRDLVDAVDDRLERTAERRAISLSLLDHLGQYTDGARLADLPSCRLADGVDDTLLTATATERPTLRLSSAAVERKPNAVTVAVSLRYKADSDVEETDSWGYAETEPIEALRVVDPDADLAVLLETFVPYAVEQSDGFANVRTDATKTTSPLDRLVALTLPRLEDVRDDLSTFVAARERAGELDDRLETIDRTIHDHVCSLYDVPESEREVVRRTVDPTENVK
ncbi:Eco57I restriction-modification methylase domain-containing protein [Natrialbaceae archaeon A-arb3/5]